MDEKKIDLLLPGDIPGVVFGTYVAGRGMNLRIMGLPWANIDDYHRWAAAGGSEDETPCLWIFQGIFESDPTNLYMLTTVSRMEAATVIGNPKMLRVMAEIKAPLVPLDPVTNDASMSVADFNMWISDLAEVPEGYEVPRYDISALSDTSLAGLEEMLRQAADNNNQEEEK